MVLQDARTPTQFPCIFHTCVSGGKLLKNRPLKPLVFVQSVKYKSVN